MKPLSYKMRVFDIYYIMIKTLYSRNNNMEEYSLRMNDVLRNRV